MPSLPKGTKKKANRLTLCALLTTLALVLSLAEKWIPLGLLIPIPGIKLGLANIVTLFALTNLNMREAVSILLCRITIGSLFFGSVTGFLFSLVGGLFALLSMSLLLRKEGTWFSLFGVSIGGAAAHNIGQVIAAVFWLGSMDVFGYLPLLLLSSIPMGLLTGFVCSQVLGHIKKIQIL